VRIALVSSSVAPERQGGSEAYASDLARSLAESHEVTLFTGARTPVDGVHTQHLPGLPDLARDASSAYKAVWHLRDQWLPAVHRALTAGLRDFAPDVVHTHQPQGLSGAVFTAAGTSDAVHVHTVHDANAFCARISMTANGEFCGGRCTRCLAQRQVRPRLLSRSVDLLLSPSRYFRDMHVSRGAVSPEQARVIPHGAPPGTTRLRERTDESFTIGFIGALAPHKGIGTLLDAFADAPQSWRLRVAGSGPFATRVETAAGADPRIEHIGFVAGAAKDGFLDSLDTIVIPSEYEENSTLVAVEAGVRGLPAAVSDRGALPETPEATVFHERNPRSLLDALRVLADSPGALEEASRRLIDSQKGFLWSTHVERVEAALRQAVAG